MTVISIFLALGIGILLGGFLGQQWLSEKQRTLIEQLTNHYNKQVEENRKLTEYVKQMQHVKLKEREQIDKLLKVTLAEELHDRYFVVMSANEEKAVRLKQLIEWAGGNVHISSTLKYLPVQADGIILFADEFHDQVTDDVLMDLKFLYHAPIFVQTTQPASEWTVDGIYPFNSSISEVFDEYQLLKYIQNILSPIQEERHHA